MSTNTKTAKPQTAEEALTHLRYAVGRYEERHGEKPKWALMGTDHPLAAAGITAALGVQFHIEDGVVFMAADGREDLRVEGSKYTLHSANPMAHLDEQDDELDDDWD